MLLRRVHEVPGPAQHVAHTILILKVVVMATQVGGDLVRGQQRHQLLDQAAGGPVLSDGPHGVVAGHQHVVLLGRRQLLLEPGQLCAGQRR
ncbi:unnamed protein product, partial [Gulo gulo]